MTAFFRILCGTFLAFVFLLTSSSSKAELQVDITQGQMAPTPIALTDLYGANSNLMEVGQAISKVVAADLERSGLFAPLDSKAFLQDISSLQAGPRFGDWRVINAQILMKGTLQEEPDGRLRVEFRLYDVFTEKQMIGLAFFGEIKHWRRISHKIADAIYKRVTGEEGYFDTRIVYVGISGTPQKPIKRLEIMDQDGENPQPLTDGRSLVLTPRFSPAMHDITYIDFALGKPKVYLMNLESKKHHLLGQFAGMTFAPRFSPDGTKMLMSFASNGVTSLYLMDLKSRNVSRLTKDPVIDTSPSFSPDGSRIVFNSDRGGQPQLYVMRVSDGSIDRISFSRGEGRASYYTPVWSPRGDLIAFTKIQGSQFYIGVMHPDGSGERLLAQGYVLDAPCWSPNGRTIMFTRKFRNGKSGIYTVDLTGYNERSVKTSGNAEAGTWSPLLP